MTKSFFCLEASSKKEAQILATTFVNEVLDATKLEIDHRLSLTKLSDTSEA